MVTTPSVVLPVPAVVVPPGMLGSERMKPEPPPPPPPVPPAAAARAPAVPARLVGPGFGTPGPPGARGAAGWVGAGDTATVAVVWPPAPPRWRRVDVPPAAPFRSKTAEVTPVGGVHVSAVP